MELFKLESFCCGCNLKIGATICGVFDLLVYFSMGTTGLVIEPDIGDFVIFFIMSGMQITIASLMIVGVWKNWQNTLIPWILIQVVDLFILMISEGSSPVLGWVIDSEILALLLSTCYVAWKFYAELIVVNLYIDMKNTMADGHRLLINNETVNDLEVA